MTDSDNLDMDAPVPQVNSERSSERLLSLSDDDFSPERENVQVLRAKVVLLMNNAKKFKAERQRINKVIKDRDYQKSQLLLCKQEMWMLRKKMGLQTKELKRQSRQSESLRAELDVARKEMRSTKQRALDQRAERQRLRERLGHAIKERDGLRGALERGQKECLELRDTIGNQLSSASKKDSQHKKQEKEIHLLKQEKRTLERERSAVGVDAEGWKRALRKCEEELQAQREMLEESKRCHDLDGLLGKKVLVIPPKAHAVKKPAKEALPSVQLGSVQRELADRTDELRRSRELCEQLKKKLTDVGPRLQRCHAVVREQTEKLKAVTAESNMYRREVEKLSRICAEAKAGQSKLKSRGKMKKKTARDGSG